MGDGGTDEKYPNEWARCIALRPFYWVTFRLSLGPPRSRCPLPERRLEVPAGKEHLRKQDGQHRIESGVDDHSVTRDEVTPEGSNT
jgi:hypothetical protein